MPALVQAKSELAHYIIPNKKGQDSIDFANPKAVKVLNAALLAHYYGIHYWDFPATNLCPAVPGRADYIHHMADLMSESNFGQTPKGPHITCLDIGVGANCIYPIIGVTEYNWNFIGSDIDPLSIESANRIIDSNPSLVGRVDCVLQKDPKDVFYGVLKKETIIDLSICNPPFHATAKEAQEGTQRKSNNLGHPKNKLTELNFSGNHQELICDGGELKFISGMIKESRKFASNCSWFSSLVSKQSNLKSLYKLLDKYSAVQVKTIALKTANKSSRIIAWSFLSLKEQRRRSAKNQKLVD